MPAAIGTNARASLRAIVSPRPPPINPYTFQAARPITAPATTRLTKPANTDIRGRSGWDRRRSALRTRNDANPVAELAIEIPRSPRGRTRARVRPRLRRTIAALTLTGVRVSLRA